MNIITHIQFGDNKSALYNKEYLVAGCMTHLSRAHSNFVPETIPSCQSMEVTVVAPGRDDLGLYEWYLTNDYRSGRVIFDIVDINSKDDGAIQREILFDDAQCYAIKECYDIEKDQRRLLTLYLSIQKCNIEDNEFLQQSANRI